MAEQKKPNILVIWGDDIGIANLSCYTHGVMGYRTPKLGIADNTFVMYSTDNVPHMNSWPDGGGGH